MKSNNFEWLLPSPVQGESWRWGRYVGPLQVEFSPGTVTWVTESLVSAEVGQRVLVRFYSGTRATIMGVLGGIGQGGLKFGLQNLTTENLNDITRGGFYRQPLNVNTSSGRNYPVNAAGLLEVFENGNMTFQRYTAYGYSSSGSGVYVRRKYEATWMNWQELQKVAAPVVTALPLKNGWVAYGGGYQYPQYEVYPDGHVQLHGLIKPGTKANNTVIATVPASLAPDSQRVFVVGASGGTGAGRVDVRPTGEITLAVFGSTTELANVTWMSLETVSW